MLTWPGEFKKAYPDAKLIAVEEAIQKHQGEDIKFDGCTFLSLLRVIDPLSIPVISQLGEKMLPILSTDSRMT